LPVLAVTAGRLSKRMTVLFLFARCQTQMLKWSPRAGTHPVEMAGLKTSRWTPYFAYASWVFGTVGCVRSARPRRPRPAFGSRLPLSAMIRLLPPENQAPAQVVGVCPRRRRLRARALSFFRPLGFFDSFSNSIRLYDEITPFHTRLMRFAPRLSC